ncbi:MAG: adenylosuccinate synthase [Candidatus Coatesbacteria bacterium]|nr:adenylosuccinate synthase [Candidatus Coatesbacteria bacterium]
MSALVLVGLQWGDEGKATVVDVFAAPADVVVRYSGGANAGHTVVVGDEKYVFHLLPVGVLHPGKMSVIASGVVLDVGQLFTEIDTLKSRGIEVRDNLIIGLRCHVTMPYHKALERMAETQRGKNAIETTLRGIGPTVVDKFSRDGIMVCDLFRDELLLQKLRRNVEIKNRILEAFGSKEHFCADEIYGSLKVDRERLKPFVGNTSSLLSSCIDSGKKVLFEGAQGTLLDVESGTYPFVTSSHPISGGVCVGSGLPPTRISKVIGVVKAYCTRVGAGPFPTEDIGEKGRMLGDIGNEFGATTGRQRRCGWIDFVALKYAIRINGASSIVVTKLDVLDELGEIPVCVGYDYQGERLSELPPEIDILAECRPVYEMMPGWKKKTYGITEYSELPEEAVNYVRRIEDETGVRVGMVSTGPRRKSTVILDKDLLNF